MGLRKLYESFLAAPSASFLAKDATLNYITTLTTLDNVASILKQLTSAVVKKQEKVLSAIESDNALCVDVETTLEFVSGGGPYLPNLDENFLADHVVTIPIIHIVHFNADEHITQIRLHWDQGCLLKLVDVIGSRGRNWPIRDGVDQVRLISNCATSDADFAKNIQATMPLRTSSKPAKHTYDDLFVSQGPSSPEGTILPKGGADKHFEPSRLFDMEDKQADIERSISPGKAYRNDKYNHFEFVDEEQEAPVSKPKEETKVQHLSSWDFEDFTTPEKVPLKIRSQDMRHFGLGDEGNEEFKTPTKTLPVNQTRRDAEKHFEFQDDGTPEPKKRPTVPAGTRHNAKLGLYSNNLYDEDSNQGRQGNENSKPAGTVRNVVRRKDLEAQFSMTDNSPQPDASNNSHAINDKPIPNDQLKAIRALDSHWQSYDKSPEPTRGIKASGNGMGGRKDAASTWDFTDENQGIKSSGNGMGGRKDAASTWDFAESSDPEEIKRPLPGKKRGDRLQAQKDFWDF